jgi:hypothetical protein
VEQHGVCSAPSFVGGTDDEDDEDDAEADRVAAERRAMLLEKGLIASDVAYSTWLRRQEGVRWPWVNDETPEGAARYSTRELWFWSRQVAGLRVTAGWAAPEVVDYTHEPCGL